MRAIEEFYAYGHENVTAHHRSTCEITRDATLGRRGDCIIAVKATKAPADFSPAFKRLCRNQEAKIHLELTASGISEIIHGKGSPHLTLECDRELVARKSSHTSHRTIMIHADKAAADLRRDLVKILTSSNIVLRIRLTVEL